MLLPLIILNYLQPSDIREEDDRKRSGKRKPDENVEKPEKKTKKDTKPATAPEKQATTPDRITEPARRPTTVLKPVANQPRYTRRILREVPLSQTESSEGETESSEPARTPTIVLKPAANQPRYTRLILREFPLSQTESSQGETESSEESKIEATTRPEQQATMPAMITLPLPAGRVQRTVVHQPPHT